MSHELKRAEHNIGCFSRDTAGIRLTVLFNLDTSSFLMIDGACEFSALLGKP